MYNFTVYLFPLLMDIIVGLVLFAGRHSLAERGYTESVVGSIPIIYGIGYVAASLFMGKIIKNEIAKIQIVLSTIIVVILSIILANLQKVILIQFMFILLPLAASLFFNAFQSFLLGVSDAQEKPLSKTVGHYILAWSTGYALGPFVCSAVKQGFSWPFAYYASAVISLAIGTIAFFLNPPNKNNQEQINSKNQSSISSGKPSLIIPAWIGVFLGWSGWNIIATYWPVQASLLGFSISVKGAVEFTFAITQALFAFALIYLKNWQNKPFFLPLFGAFGVAGLLVFAFSHESSAFIAGSIFYGIYTSSIFTFMLYHSMHDVSQSVKRIAVNEVIVGACFVAGPVFAFVIHKQGTLYFSSYVIISCCLGAGIIAETFIAYLKVKKTAV